jgi:hypothetical protein
MQDAALAKKKLNDASTPLLDGRLYLRLLEGTVLEPRSTSIMGAPESHETETRAICDAGDERLVIMAHEMFRSAGDDFEKGVRGEVATWSTESGWNYQIESLKLKRGRAFLVAPSKNDIAEQVSGRRDHIFVLCTLIENPDRTVQMVNFFVNQAAARNMDNSISTCRELAATAASGTRKLTFKAGRRVFRDFDREFAIQVPDNFVMSSKGIHDFSVHTFTKVVPLGMAPSTFGIYLGSFPDLQYRQRRANAPLAKTSGTLLGQKVEWLEWTDKNEHICETILPISMEKGLLMHAFGNSGDPKELKELRRIMESLEGSIDSESNMVGYGIAAIALISVGLAGLLYKRRRNRPNVLRE